MKNRLGILLRHSVVTMVTLALLSLPFAHRVGAAPVTSEITQFLVDGGQFADICGTAQTHAAGGCESCRIVNAVMLAEPAMAPILQTLAARVVPLNRTKGLAAPDAAHRTPPVRAPPRPT